MQSLLVRYLEDQINVLCDAVIDSPVAESHRRSDVSLTL